MLALTPEGIPKLRKVSAPKQSVRDALVTSLAALVDRSLMRTVTFVVEKKGFATRCRSLYVAR